MSSLFKEGNELWKLRKQDGRYKIFETPEDLWNAAVEYWEWCIANPIKENKLVTQGLESVIAEVEKPRPFTKAGLYTHLGIVRKTFENYKNNEDYKEYRDVVEQIENVMYEQKFTHAAAGLFNHSIIARDLGLVEKQELSGDPDKPLVASITRTIVKPDESANSNA